MDKTHMQKPIQFPSILKSTAKSPLGRKLTSSERKREIEKQFGIEVPKRHDIVNMLVSLDKNLDLVDDRLKKTIDYNRDVVLNAMKGKLYNIQKEIKELEEKTEKEAIKKRIDEEIRMLNNDIEQIRLESTKLEDKRRTLEKQLKKLQANNKVIDDEERFLTEQIQSNSILWKEG